jgi:hypothetical protein
MKAKLADRSDRRHFVKSLEKTMGSKLPTVKKMKDFLTFHTIKQSDGLFAGILAIKHNGRQFWYKFMIASRCMIPVFAILWITGLTTDIVMLYIVSFFSFFASIITSVCLDRLIPKIAYYNWDIIEGHKIKSPEVVEKLEAFKLYCERCGFKYVISFVWIQDYTEHEYNPYWPSSPDHYAISVVVIDNHAKLIYTGPILLCNYTTLVT